MGCQQNLAQMITDEANAQGVPFPTWDIQTVNLAWEPRMLGWAMRLMTGKVVRHREAPGSRWPVRDVGAAPSNAMAETAAAQGASRV